jgi:predicted transcriptional regulator of viral defense system
MSLVEYVHEKRSVSVTEVSELLGVTKQRAQQILSRLVTDGQVVRGANRSYCVPGFEHMDARPRQTPKRNAVLLALRGKGWVLRSETGASLSTIQEMVESGDLWARGRSHVALPGTPTTIRANLSVSQQVLEYIQQHKQVKMLDIRSKFKVRNLDTLVHRLVERGLVKRDEQGYVCHAG